MRYEAGPSGKGEVIDLDDVVNPAGLSFNPLTNNADLALNMFQTAIF